MGHGIGPQSLGASGMNPKSTACGHPKVTPLDFTKELRDSLPKIKKDSPEFAAAILENDPAANYGMEKKTDGTSPIDFNVFENADPRAAANMMSDMAPTGGGAPAPSAPTGIAPGDTARPQNGGFRGIGGLLRRKAGRTGRGSGALESLAEKIGNARPTVNTPGGGAGGALAAAEEAQASADAANNQMDVLKEKLSGIRNLLDQTSGMI